MMWETLGGMGKQGFGQAARPRSLTPRWDGPVVESVFLSVHSSLVLTSCQPSPPPAFRGFAYPSQPTPASSLACLSRPKASGSLARFIAAYYRFYQA